MLAHWAPAGNIAQPVPDWKGYELVPGLRCNRPNTQYDSSLGLSQIDSLILAVKTMLTCWDFKKKRGKLHLIAADILERSASGQT